METNSRKFRNLISTAQLVKQMKQRGYENEYTEQAIYTLFERYGITPKTKRGGKAYFNRHNACTCIERHIFELHEIAEELKNKMNDTSYLDSEVEDDTDADVGYGRDDMSVVSRELLAKDGVFGSDENELYTNECKKIIKISEEKYRKLFKAK